MSQPAATPIILAWARLLRLPNVFTVVADVLMGHWFVAAGVPSPLILVLAVATTSLLYLAGMVWNDWFDHADDLRERPWRPLPSRQISRRSAAMAGGALLLLGTTVGMTCIRLAGDVAPREAAEAGAVLIALVACILAYDGGLKRTWCGPWVMGACRMLDIVWGMICGHMACRVAGIAPDPTASWLYDRWRFVPMLDDAGWLVAVGIGVYIAGVTYLARDEAAARQPSESSEQRQTQSRGKTLVPIAVMLFGLVLLASFPAFGAFAGPDRHLVAARGWGWPLLIAVLGWTVLRRAWRALRVGSPSSIQLAVKQAIVSLVVLDAATCMAVRSPLLYGLSILSLLIPMLLLGRRIYST